MFACVFFLAFFLVQDLPLKPAEEFDMKLNYQFRQRPADDLNTVHLGRKYDPRVSSTVLPYLVLNIRMLQLPEEKMRLRVTNNLDEKVIQKKVTVNSVVDLDLGFTDDMKDRVTAHVYTLIFLTEEKRPAEKILIEVGEDGSFYVNGVKRGSF